MSQEAMLSKQYMTGWWCDYPDSGWAWRGNLLFQFSFYGMSGEPNFLQKKKNLAMFKHVMHVKIRALRNAELNRENSR